MPDKNVANWTLADYERAAEQYSERLRDAHDLPEQLDKARQQVVREKRKADQQKSRAEEEKKRADAAEEEVKRLQAQLTEKVGTTKKRKRNGS